MAIFLRPSGEILGDDEDGSVDAAVGAPSMGNRWLYTLAGPRSHRLMDPLWPLVPLDGTDASGRQSKDALGIQVALYLRLLGKLLSTLSAPLGIGVLWTSRHSNSGVLLTDLQVDLGSFFLCLHFF